jgi:putative peptidoglycan lipid II flippase
LGMWGLGFRYIPKIAWKNQSFIGVLKRLPPRSLDQGIDQVNGIVEANRANLLYKGAVSDYTLATTLHNVPVMLLGNAVATAAFPRLTERLSQHRPDLFRKDFLSILQVMIWMTAPVVVVAYFCRGYLARLILGTNAPQVAQIFGFLTVAILFRVTYSMLSRYFYAHKDTRTPLMVSIFAIGLNIVLAFNLVSRDHGYGIAGLAIAQSLVAASEVAILLTIMVYRDRKLLNRYFLSSLSRIASVTGFTVMAGYIMLGLLPLQAADTGFITLGSKLAIITLVVMTTHVFLSWLFELEEGKTVIDKARRTILRPLRIQ